MPPLDVTIVDPCVRTNFKNAARQAGKHIAHVIEWKKYQGSFLATYPLFLLAMSMCGEFGPGVDALVKEPTIRRASFSSELSSELHFEE